MRESDDWKECPVCHMVVSKNSHTLVYKGHDYAFCSEQCRERFEINPHLYVGHPGHPSPAQQGHEIIKTRRLKLKEAPDDAQCFVIKSALNNMMGIGHVAFENEYLIIRYDLLQVTAEQIEIAIENTGNRLSACLGTRLRQAFVHYMEESELDNLEEPGGGHRH